MSTVQSLEQERQAILDRMQMRREAYRRVLHDGGDLNALPARVRPNGTARTPLYEGATADTTTYRYTHVSDTFPRTRLMKTVSEHPMLLALGVAAVFAIGPRRLARSVATGGAALGAVAGSRSNMDLLSRMLTLASAIAQRRVR